MSLRRRIALVFIAVNGLTLLFLVSFAIADGRKAQRIFERDQIELRERTSNLLALMLEGGIRRELERSAATETLDGSRSVIRAIAKQQYWDEDDQVRLYLDKVVIVRYDPVETVLFNPRRRFIFEQGAIDKSRVRALLDAADGVEHAGNIHYGRIKVPEQGGRKWGFYFRIKEQDVGSTDPIDTVWTVALITIPGTVFLLVFVYFFFSRSVMRPLSNITAAAARMAKHDYSEPVSLDPRRLDELGQLARVLNETMSQLKEYQQTMQRLVDDATGKFKEAQKHLVVAQRLAAMGHLAAGIAHEINNPLGGILNALEKLARPDLDDERRHKYHVLAEEALDRIGSIVKRVLATAPRDVPISDIHLGPVIEQAAGLVQHRFQRQGIVFASRIPAELRIRGSRAELPQVFLNLFINACDAMPGGGHLNVDARRTEHFAEIRVTDTGVGIPDHVRPHIFDLFFTTKAGGEGTGLGLGIVHTIITGLGGTISVESEPLKGTCFILRLKLAEAVAD